MKTFDYEAFLLQSPVVLIIGKELLQEEWYEYDGYDERGPDGDHERHRNRIKDHSDDT